MQRNLQSKLKGLLLELGLDFCFVGSEYLLQIGSRDFALDLLFFHRDPNALVTIELKVRWFEPEHQGKLSFHLNALDRDYHKIHKAQALGHCYVPPRDNGSRRRPKHSTFAAHGRWGDFRSMYIQVDSNRLYHFCR